MQKSEKILVVPKNKLDLNNLTIPKLKSVVDTFSVWKDREKVEHDDFYIQPIPYIAITYRDKVYCYQRLSKGGEKRLEGMKSIGLGGHVSKGTVEGLNYTAVEDTASIEIEEEITLVEQDHKLKLTPYNYKWIATFYDDSTEVGKHHIAIFGTYNMDYYNKEPNLISGEPEKMQGQLVDKSSIDIDSLENWSQELIKLI